MKHLTELTCVLYLDRALPAHEHADASTHLDQCQDCSARLADLTQEAALLRQAFALDDTPVVIPDALPDFTRSISLRQFAVANLFTGLLVWLGQFLWKTLFGDLVINAISWFTLIPIPDLFDLTVDAVTYFSAEGSTMIDTYVSFVGFIVIAVSLTWLALSFRKQLRSLQLVLVTVLCVGLLAPAPAGALEVRHGDKLLDIAADETVNDSLLVFGDTITIDGTVTGNLVAMGDRVIINGQVGGNLITLAETVSISGKVAGTMLAAGETIEFGNAEITGDVLGAASDITLGDKASVRGNATLAASRIAVKGGIGRDLWAFGESIELSGTIGEDLEVYASRLNLLGQAVVTGDVRLRSDSEDNLQVASSARVGGEVEFLPREETTEENRYLTGSFYLGQVLHLGGQFIVGLILFWLIPGLRQLALEPGIDGLKTAGIGLVAVVSLPIIALLAAVTLIGLPVGLIGFFGWIVAIYLAKILLALVIGRALLGGRETPPGLPLTLFAGLVIVLVAANLPAIGGVISFLLTIAGFGLLVQAIANYLADLDRGESAY